MRIDDPIAEGLKVSKKLVPSLVKPESVYYITVNNRCLR